MGGTIRVIVKESDTVEHRMFRWTNSFPDFISSNKFIDKDMEHLKEYMSVYLEMKDDYERNHESGEFENFMTDAYFPETDYLGPSGYGLLVIDYTTNKVLSCQGYSYPGKLLSYSLKGVFDGDEETLKRNIGCNIVTEEEVEDYREMLEKGRLNNARYWDSVKEEIVEKKLTKEGFLKIVKDEQLDFYEYLIDMSPWEIKAYTEDRKGLEKMKNDMLEMGFKFTEEDDKLWEEYMRYE